MQDVDSIVNFIMLKVIVIVTHIRTQAHTHVCMYTYALPWPENKGNN